MPPPGAHTPCRLLVLTGAPGVGKTTLATNVARDVAANAPHVQVSLPSACLPVTDHCAAGIRPRPATASGSEPRALTDPPPR